MKTCLYRILYPTSVAANQAMLLPWETCSN